MYFRLKTTPSGKVLQLLESYRNENGNPRQRVVVSLGNASIPKENQRDVAKGVEKHLYSYCLNMGKRFDCLSNLLVDFVHI